MTDFAHMEKLVDMESRGVLAGARGCGRTTFAAHAIALMVKRARPNMMIVWPVPNWSWIAHVMEVLQKAFEEHDLPIAGFDHRRGVVTVAGTDARITVLPIVAGCQNRLLGCDFDLVDDLGELEDNIKKDKMAWEILKSIRQLERVAMKSAQRVRAMRKYRARSTPGPWGTFDR